MAPSLAVRVLGSGPSVMLVHGDVAPGPTWKTQEALAERWRVVIATRRGFRMSPAAEEQDPDLDARDLEKLLTREPAHCVGFQAGAAGLALAAARTSDLVRSLTLIEPPAFAESAAPDLEALAESGLGLLVLSGDHDPEVEATCDSLALRLGAARERLPGAGHAVQRAEGFNARLERFLFGAELAASKRG